MREWGSGGKYHNVGLTRELLPATKRQIRFLGHLARRLGRREEVEGKYYNRGEASALIDKLQAELEAERRLLANAGERGNLFAALMKMAVREANTAGERWLREHPDAVFKLYDPETDTSEDVHGAVGASYIAFPRGRSAFARWLEEHQGAEQRRYVEVPHRFTWRPERDLQAACERAALRVLEEGGVRGLKLVVQDVRED